MLKGGEKIVHTQLCILIFTTSVQSHILCIYKCCVFLLFFFGLKSDISFLLFHCKFVPYVFGVSTGTGVRVQLVSYSRNKTELTKLWQRVKPESYRR